MNFAFTCNNQPNLSTCHGWFSTPCLNRLLFVSSPCCGFILFFTLSCWCHYISPCCDFILLLLITYIFSMSLHLLVILFYLYHCLSNDGVQPKTSSFSTCHLIWVKYKFVSQLFQPIFLSFSYLNSARHFSVIEMCREPIFIFCSIAVL